jgi:DNA-binding transcriptional LysR family regulator
VSIQLAARDLNLLLGLHTVLSERNVARAAERLRVTPSAVSNALARLRALLDDPLVTRKGRGIVPTPRALELAPRLARVMQELELALVDQPFDAAQCTRTFSLAVADAGQLTWVPRLARTLARELPRAKLRVLGIEALIALGNLSSSEVDLHIGVPAKGPGVHVEPLYEEAAVLVARRGHRLFARKMSPRLASELRHVRVEMVAGKNFRDPFAAAYVRAGIAREVVVIVPTFSAAAEVVAASDLVTILPKSLFAAKGGKLGLRAVRAPIESDAIPIAMCWHDRTHGDPAARAFRALVRAQIAART